MASLKSITLLLIVFVALVSCDQKAEETVEGDVPQTSINRFVRQSKETEVEPPVHGVQEDKSPLMIRKLKGQEGDSLDESKDAIQGMQRVKRSTKSFKKGGGVAKGGGGGGGGCKKGRK